MELPQLIQSIHSQFHGAVIEGETTALCLKKERLLEVAKFLKESELAFQNLHCVTAVDWRDKMEVVYHLYSFKHRFMLVMKVFLTPDDLTVDTLSYIWKSADWLEREVYDLFGVKFLNHPNLCRILNPEEWTDYPLRKDFSRPDFIRLPQTEGLKKGVA